MISDGQDTRSVHSYNQLRNRLKTLDAQIYAIGIADPALDAFAGYQRWFFEDITRQSGRQSFLMNPDAAIGKAVLAEMSRTQIALELRQQYTLGFYSNATNSKELHRLKVRVRETEARSNLRLSYREGYQPGGTQ